MEMTVTLGYGPLDAEFTGENREEVQENLVDFVEFLNENDEVFDGVDVAAVAQNGAGGQHIDEAEVVEVESEASEEVDDEHPMASLARQVGTTTDVLDDIVYVDPDGEEEPQILVDKNLLGGSKTERQRAAAYLILRVWDDCYGEDRMKTSVLMDILTMAGVSDVDIFNAWRGPGKGDFDSRGQGGSATVGLTGPGRRTALEVMKELVEEQSD